VRGGRRKVRHRRRVEHDAAAGQGMHSSIGGEVGSSVACHMNIDNSISTRGFSNSETSLSTFSTFSAALAAEH
jgi:hypothetical protein